MPALTLACAAAALLVEVAADVGDYHPTRFSISLVLIAVAAVSYLLAGAPAAARR